MSDFEQGVADKSYSLALRIIKLYQYLKDEKKEFVLSKQVLRSGTSIGAQVREAKFAQSRADFISKLSIALKEANETQYWLQLLYETKYITEKEFASIHNDLVEILRILTAICKHYPQSNQSICNL